MKNLLVAYDYSESSDIAVQTAINIAGKFHSHIWLLNIVEPDPEFLGYSPGPDTVMKQVADEYHAEHKKLQEIAMELKQEYENITALSIQGSTVDAILSQAEKLDVDMILLGSKGKGSLKSILLGSVSEDVVRNSNRSVLVCR